MSKMSGTLEQDWWLYLSGFIFKNEANLMLQFLKSINKVKKKKRNIAPMKYAARAPGKNTRKDVVRM